MNIVLEEKVTATILLATAVTVHFGVSMTTEICYAAHLWIIDGELRTQTAEITIFTANTINTKLREAALITMID